MFKNPQTISIEML